MSFEGAGSGKHHRDKFYSCVVQKKKFLQKSVNVVEQGNGQKKWKGQDVAWWERGSAATTEQHVGGRDWNNVLRSTCIHLRTLLLGATCLQASSNPLTMFEFKINPNCNSSAMLYYR